MEDAGYGDGVGIGMRGRDARWWWRCVLRDSRCGLEDATQGCGMHTVAGMGIEKDGDANSYQENMNPSRTEG